MNYLSLRAIDLNTEDDNNLTVLMHQIFASNFIMASRIISRGGNINYVNKNGKTILHLLCENMNFDGIKFVLENGGNPHIMDLSGMDVCDKAKQLGIVE